MFAYDSGRSHFYLHGVSQVYRYSYLYSQDVQRLLQALPRTIHECPAE